MSSRTEQSRTTANTINTLRRFRGYSDARLAEKAGMSRSQVEARRSLRSVIDVDDLERLAKGLGVPTPVLLLDANEAIRWVIDNEESDGDQAFPQSGWSTGSPALAA